MSEDAFVPLVIFGAITAWVVFPIYFRNKLYHKQLDTVAMALEKGVDPERIKLTMPRGNDDEDVNGNWKAGVVLIALGIAFDVMTAMAYFQFDDFREQDGPGLMVLMPGVISIILGLSLIFIHRTIIGPIQRRPRRALGSSDYDAAVEG